jgi:uncharacterized membrane protein/protein-disulfide isomerase
MSIVTNESFVENGAVSKSKSSGKKPQFRGLPGFRFAALIAVPAIAALAVSAYLSYVALTSSKIAGCGGGIFDCEHVLNSKWSTFFGIPVGVLATATYVGLLAALGTVAFTQKDSRVNRGAWALINLLGFSAGLAAVWFISLQVFLLGHLCKYCLIAHGCGLLIATALLVRRPFTWKFSSSVAGLAASGLAVIAIVQVNSPEPKLFKMERHDIIVTPPAHPVNAIPGDADVFGAPIEEDDSVFDAPFDDASIGPAKRDLHASFLGLSRFFFLSHPTLLTSVLVTPQETAGQQTTSQTESTGATTSDQAQSGQEEVVEERRLISIRGGAVKLDVKQWPLLGKTDAKHVFVEMFDYACPHCRNTHNAIRHARETLGADLAIIVLPVPLNNNCNNTVQNRDMKFAESCELSRLAVAVWRLDAAKFCEFHEWMFQGASAPTYASAKQHADLLIGKVALDGELAKSACGQYISKHVELYKRVGQGNVPKLLFPGTSVDGEYSSGPALVDLIRREAK